MHIFKGVNTKGKKMQRKVGGEKVSGGREEEKKFFIGSEIICTKVKFGSLPCSCNDSHFEIRV